MRYVAVIVLVCVVCRQRWLRAVTGMTQAALSPSLSGTPVPSELLQP